MKHALWLLWPVVICAGMTTVGLAGRAAARAEADARAEIQRLNSLAGQAETLCRLRAARPAQPVARTSESGLATSIGAAIAACGLPPSTLGSVAPESQTRGIGPLKALYQRATVTLVPISLPQIGAFLDSWRRREPAWTVSSIELAPDTRPANPGADIPLRAILVIEATSLQSTGAES